MHIHFFFRLWLKHRNFRSQGFCVIYFCGQDFTLFVSQEKTDFFSSLAILRSPLIIKFI